MGLFFFYEALLGFMCLTSLQVFASERILFVRERANGYYSPTQCNETNSYKHCC